jgi:hypothetical protein
MLQVLGWHQSNVPSNEAQLDVNLLTGTDDHFVYSGTFTLSEPEWDELVRALRAGLKGRLEIAIGPLGERGGRARRRGGNAGKAA